ncbi:MAG: site-specific DNA-methyltransferase, partial [Stellaceae bacterium]
RSFVGIERERHYAALARRRIAAVEPAETELVQTQGKRAEKRVPFGTLVERGLLRPGDILFDAGRRWSAKVRADGSLVSAATKGSIHRVAAEIQGAPACNGWDFWYVERQGRPVPIDWFRQQVRAELG